MNSPHFFLSIPGLRRRDLELLPALVRNLRGSEPARLLHSFPSVTWPAQATLLTGKLPSQHGVIANGFYWREEHRVEMWTADNRVIASPQVWDTLHNLTPGARTAAWFPMLSKGSGADYICMPAPIHQPDGSETLWCYSRPRDFYGELLQRLGHFPLQHFWGPLANIRSSQWIADSARVAAERFHPDFFYVYLPHLDYAAQKSGPDSPEARQALLELNQLLDEFIPACNDLYAPRKLAWTAVSEYVIRNVSQVTYPNRILREAGLLQVRTEADGEHLDLQNSAAWALVDHQFAQVFVRNADRQVIQQVADLFETVNGIAECWSGSRLAAEGLDHPRCGELVLLSQPDSWQAYYWWLDDSRAPGFARTVDIHRKPGYDPVELFFDPVTKSIPLQAERVRGSHGLIVPGEDEGVLLSTLPAPREIRDTEVKKWIETHGLD